MYNKIININLFNKILFLLVSIIITIFAQNIYILGFIAILLLTVPIFVRSNTTFNLITLSIVLLVLKNYYSFLEITFRYFMIMGSIILFLDVLKKEEKTILLEKLFYRNPKRTKMIIGITYGKNLSRLHKEKYALLKRILTPYRKYVQYINKQIEIKRKNTINDIYLYSRLRFYNYYKKRRSVSSNKWNTIDNTVLLISLMVIVLFVIWR